MYQLSDETVDVIDVASNCETTGCIASRNNCRGGKRETIGTESFSRLCYEGLRCDI